MKLHVTKHLGKLVPTFNSDRDKLTACKLKEGEVYEIEIKKPRNYEFHKKYFALLNLCFDNQDKFDEFDDLRSYLIIKAGHYKSVDTGKGTMYLPKSISFANMEQGEFELLYNQTIDAICRFIDVEKEAILEEIVNFM